MICSAANLPHVRHQVRILFNEGPRRAYSTSPKAAQRHSNQRNAGQRLTRYHRFRGELITTAARTNLMEARSLFPFRLRCPACAAICAAFRCASLSDEPAR